MVQKWQWRKSHVDAHYAAALFRYKHEFAIRFKQFTTLVCLDDKHHIKVGEPGYPVAAVDCGRRVIVCKDVSFEVGNHDFTKVSIVPSVTLVADIPNTLAGSWYEGKVVVTLKEAAFEPILTSMPCH